MKFTPKLFIAVLIYGLTSCISSKQVTYWQDAGQTQSSKNSGKGTHDSLIDTTHPDIVIQTFDVLDIKIKSSKQAFDDLLQSNAPGIYSFGAAGASSAAPSGGGGASTTSAAGGIGAYYSGFFVDASGDVTLPVLGKIHVKNLTIDEAKTLIAKKMGEFVNEPYVEIKFLSFKVQILGNVKNPGTITISNEKANLIEALAMANDLNDYANPKKIKVIRGDLKRNYKVFIVDLTSLQKTRESDAFYLQPNDIIYVEPLPRKFFLANVQSIVSAVVIINTSIILYRVFSGK